MSTDTSGPPTEPVFADTNLFLRYLTNDVPEQASAVESLLSRAAEGEVTLVTNTLVFAEIIWTLESFYRLSRLEIQEKATAIVNTPGLAVPEADLILQALAEYVLQNVDFIDAYNHAWMLQHGSTQVYTFDRRHFSRLTGITVRVPGEEPTEYAD